ncbi:MAG: ABC transporter substrate-binding protein [Deltaproteobacteria bacterium]|nr:ABC transporter substrate-binding protein [Deltaproteobacteria bacterium]MBW2015804.1 ABC transporter substrate-binding protein [Deltaproteobacteria bacterium]MBW2129212.1 ABC transporter substrate-binding protein [Deltaproteobacteria bacterium]MBW2303367.1 ABC transporter substrate-binding protein [Deltaproteobacteria bacterium]
MKKWIVGIVLIAFFCVPFMIVQHSYAADNVWRIGTIFPMTGPLSKNGIKNSDGVKIATEMINDAGGVLGKKVVLVSADAPDPQAAASEANRLITHEKVTAIIGTQASSLSMAATTVAEKNKIFYLENEGISGLITARGFKYIFRTTFNSTMMTTQMVDYAADVLGPRKLGKKASELRLAIIHEDGGFGTSSGKGLMARAKQRGLKVVASETYSAKSTDLSSLVLKLKRAKPDILLAAQYINDSILFHRQAREMRFKTLVIGTTAGQGNPDFYKALGKDAEGVLAGGIPSEISVEGLAEGPKKDAKEFVRRYRESHNGEYPNPTSFVGFAGAWVLYKFILPKAGSLDPEKLREAALSLDIPRGQGVLNWGVKFAGPDQKNAGQNLYASAAINQWQNGEMKLIYPREIASSDLK